MPHHPPHAPQQLQTTQDEVDPLKEWTEVKLLGKGGFGEVLLYRNVNTGEEQAVKKVSFDPSNHQEAQSFKREIKIFRSLRHDRIVAYCDAVEVNAVFYIFMEYMSGGSIQQLLHSGPLDELLTRKYTRQILEGVAYLHIKEIVHRDIKGANVLLDSDGNVKLADFGVSKQLQTITTGLTAAGVMKGTYNWIAPEVMNSRFPVTTKVDIWSVGCTVVEMLSGKPPLHGLQLVTVLFKIGNEPEKFHSCLSLSCSERVHYFLSQCFAVDPDARMSAVELLGLPFLKNKLPDEDNRVLEDSDAPLSSDLPSVPSSSSSQTGATTADKGPSPEMESLLTTQQAVQILDLFREQFIEEMDADAVVLELLHNNIIDRGDERRITMTVDPTQQNQFLHFILKEKCTEEAFETVCDIITAVKGNPKMKALGESMKRRLETGAASSSDQERRVVLCQPVHSVGHRQCVMLFRRFVSRNAAGRGRAMLEGVGLSSEAIRMCYSNSPHNEEEAVQSGLNRWKDGEGVTPPTWKVLFQAMDYAGIAVQHITSLEEELLKAPLSSGLP